MINAYLQTLMFWVFVWVPAPQYWSAQLRKNIFCWVVTGLVERAQAVPDRGKRGGGCAQIVY